MCVWTCLRYAVCPHGIRPTTFRTPLSETNKQLDGQKNAWIYVAMATYCFRRMESNQSGRIHTCLVWFEPNQRNRWCGPLWAGLNRVVSARFHTNTGPVRLRCESDRARSDLVLKKICLFGRNRLPLLLVYLYCLISTVNSKALRHQTGITLSVPLKMSRGRLNM